LPAEAAPSYLWVPGLGEAVDLVELSPEESHYLVRVCRAREGDRVIATDGRGALARLRVLSLGERVRAAIETLEHPPADPLRRRAWILCGAPEDQRGDWMVEKLAELGVEVWQPIECARARWRFSPGTLARWQRLAVAALKQSRRRFILEVRAPAPLAEAASGIPPEAACWMADPEGQRGAPAPAGMGWTVGAIGPSKGFDPGEKDFLGRRAFKPICLSDGRLRAETAALAWAAWWGRGSG